MSELYNESILDEIVVGRVEPHIYAFTTNTIPNYLKVGDTYRPVSVRLKEWEVHYPNLEKKFEGEAKIEDVFFRDFSVHQFLESEKKKLRLQVSDLPQNIYYSKEFFKETTTDDIIDAIDDIKNDYQNKTQKYQFYSVETLRPEETCFPRIETYPMRPNQEKTVNAFRNAINNGRRNLLMYAVMRFGKSFTSMCCAVEMNAKLVVVVSAKADVLTEWKRTVESHVKFDGYEFITAKILENNNHVITDKLISGKKVVVFITLQDLQGEKIKDKHQEVFGQDIDLLLVDETHFGARAEKYGEVLKNDKNYEREKEHKKDNDDFVDVDEADKTIKTLKTNITIHLSGTPYRILMGSEFKKEDIIAFYQFTDIVDDQKEWDKNHVLDDNYKEWDNPYYGFPQMIRFAFHPNESSRKRLEELKKSGITYAFSALFKPQSIKKADDGTHKKFINEKEILELLEVIDGSKTDEELLSFLDYDKLKEGKMCRHIVFVLPYCASCDALEELIKNNKDKFRNLNDYEIVNISGVENQNAYKSPKDIKRTITEFESKNKKTITLTVNRMLTGSTVPEWDTMLYLKDTASPQEYDQAVFRLQNQYVKTYKDETTGESIRFNMKPQTLLVDFDPNRMFIMQEKKSKIYNANVDTGGNSELEKRIRKELEVSPIITINKDKIERVVATDILKAVSNYQKDKGIKDEALEIPVDLSILDDDSIRAVIELENEIGSKSGLSIPAHDSEENGENEDIEIDIPKMPNNDEDSSQYDVSTISSDDKRTEEISNTKKIQNYYTRILLFAFITKDYVISLSDIVDKFDEIENTRIAKNLGLTKKILMLLNQKTNKFVLSDLDYKIQDLNNLSKATDLSPEQRANVAVNKFGKLGDAIVITPSNICDDMVNLLPEEFLKSLPSTNGKILDIAGTSGEFAVALQKRMTELGLDKNFIANAIYTIPKSSVCYELTRKLYEMLGLNIKNIAKEFIATDMLNVKIGDKVDYDKIKALLTQNKPFETIKLTDTITEGEEKVNIEAVIGNPPYQEMDGGAGTSAGAVYNLFVENAKKLKPSYISMIMPARWYAGGKGLDDFRSSMLNDKKIKTLVDFPNCNDVFPTVDIAGGLCYFLRTNEKNETCLIKSMQNGKSVISERKLNEYDIFVRDNRAIDIIKKANNDSKSTLEMKVSSRKPFGLPTNYQPKESGIPCWFIQKIGQKFANEKDIDDSNGLLNKWKFLAPKSPIAGQTDFTKPVGFYYDGNTKIAKPGECCTESFIVLGAFDTEEEVLNYKSYILTKTIRFLLLQAVVSQDVTKKCFCFVPDLEKYDEVYTDEKLCKLWNISKEEWEYIDSRICDIKGK